MRDFTERELVEWCDKERCPFCGATNFYEGPSGGLCTNIKCAGCEAEMNVVLGMRMRFGQLLHDPKPDKVRPPVETRNITTRFLTFVRGMVPWRSSTNHRGS